MDKLSAAILYVVANDTGIATLTGRAVGLAGNHIVHWSDIGSLPDVGIAYVLPQAPITGAELDNRLPRYRFSCFGLDLQKAWDLANRLETILTATALKDATPSVDAAPMVPESVDRSELEDPARKRKRVDLTIEFDAMRT